MDWQSILRPQPKDLETTLQSKSKPLPCLIPSQAEWLLFHNSLHFVWLQGTHMKMPQSWKNSFFCYRQKEHPIWETFPSKSIHLEGKFKFLWLSVFFIKKKRHVSVKNL